MAESWKGMFIVEPSEESPTDKPSPEIMSLDSICDDASATMPVSNTAFSENMVCPLPSAPVPNSFCSEPSEPFLGLGTPVMGDAPSDLFGGRLSYVCSMRPKQGSTNTGYQDVPHVGLPDGTESMWTSPLLTSFNEHQNLPECGAGLPLKTESTGTSLCSSTFSKSPSMKQSVSSVSSSSQPSYRIEKKKMPNERERNRRAAAKCRKKAKLSQMELQERERMLKQQNRHLLASISELKEEVLNLKNEILKHNGCRSELIDKYIWKAAQGSR
ncbi:hypothetical protein F5Y06DRAFT_294459 [Hypoxylon sp. FL0890]|nr:hypothetical protein F5Y06DRAFT_294459 [Hypoxylon sp. FL0890]